VRGFVDGLLSQLSIIRVQQWTVAWENHVHLAFHARDGGAADGRRRMLVLDLSNATPNIVPFSKLRTISPRVAAAYADRTDKTLSRDVNVLLAMGLVARDASGVRATREIILAFLPVTRFPDGTS